MTKTILCLIDRRSMMVGGLLPLAVLAMSTILALPVHADPGVDSALGASSTSGTLPGTAGSTSLGSSVCTAIEQPGQTMTSIASTLAAQDGTSPRVSKILTGLSISVFCPTLMASMAGDDWLNLLGNTGR